MGSEEIGSDIRALLVTTLPHAPPRPTSPPRPASQVHLDESYDIVDATVYFRVHDDGQLYLLYLPAVQMVHTPTGTSVWTVESVIARWKSIAYRGPCIDLLRALSVEDIECSGDVWYRRLSIRRCTNI